MNANKQDAGGLPELPKEAAGYMRGCNIDLQEGDLLFTADQMRAYGELCRAAPAGSGEACDNCGKPLRADHAPITACACARLVLTSAYAGQGGVEAVAQKLLVGASELELRFGEASQSPVMRTAAALLRKLQQGADYEPAFWNVRKDGKHLILFPLNGAVTITTYLEMVAGAHPEAAIDAETLYRAASPRKEAFNG